MSSNSTNSSFKPFITSLEFAMQMFPNNDYEDVKDLADHNVDVSDIPISAIFVENAFDRENIVMPDDYIEQNEDTEYIAELVDDLSTSGVFEDPIVVKYSGSGEYEWVDGQHRATAAHKSGATKIRAIVIL